MNFELELEADVFEELKGFSLESVNKYINALVRLHMNESLPEHLRQKLNEATNEMVNSKQTPEQTPE